MDSYKFDIPAHHKSIIKVVGVGGGGSNAVTHMFNQGIKDVEFVICNTDAQALKGSQVPTKLQIGPTLTEGLGAGANPDVGMNAALENKEEIRELLSTDTKMVFITAGMGGGTGTGAAPVIASVARELNILTVGIVTAPFSFEGKKKAQFAQAGIDQMREHCDTVLVISNDKLREVFGNLSIRDAFSRADNVLTTAAKSIAEIITVTSEVNVDFQDVKAVMKNSGAAVMGSAVAEGENRARRAVEDAISSPLLDNTDIKGAKNILLSITYGDQAELTMDELTEITDYIEDKAGSGADVIFGQGIDTELGGACRVTLIATGFDEKEFSQKPAQKTVFDLETNQQIENKAEEQPKSFTQTNRPTRTGYSFERPQQREEPKREENRFEQPDLFSQQSEESSMNKASEAENTDYNEPSTSEGKVIFKIDGDYEITDVTDESAHSQPMITPERHSSEQRTGITYNRDGSEDLEAKKRALDKQSKERVQRLKGINDTNMDPDEFKERLEIPAYKRKNVTLKDVPHSSENEVSRYNLNDDNEILGNNKFLHDNVD